MHVAAMAALVAAGVAAPAVLAGNGSPARASGSFQERGPALWIRHAGLSERATRGSFCVATVGPGGSSSGGCADAAYPLPTRGRLPVRPGGPVVVRTSVRATSLQARLVRVRGSSFDLAGRRLDARRLSARRWAVRIPPRLPSGSVLDVSLRWNDARDGQGDADFWGAVRAACS